MIPASDRTLTINKTSLKFLDTFQVVFLNATQNTLLPEIYEVFGAEPAMKFLDVFAGTTITIPSRKRFTDCVRDTDVYLALVASDGKDSDVTTKLASKYDLDRQTILHIYNKTKSTIKKVEPDGRLS